MIDINKPYRTENGFVVKELRRRTHKLTPIYGLYVDKDGEDVVTVWDQDGVNPYNEELNLFPAKRVGFLNFLKDGTIVGRTYDTVEEAQDGAHLYHDQGRNIVARSRIEWLEGEFDT